MNKPNFRSFAAQALVAGVVGIAGGLPASAQEAVDIPVPDDPVTRAAFDALDKHCARCHQDGRLVNLETASKNFGNVLMMDSIASDPNLVVPGNPDGSKLVKQLLNEEMPYDLAYGIDFTQPPVEPEDLEAIRAWVTQLGETSTAACDQRDYISQEDMVATMARDLDRVQDTRVADTRYLTLTHLYNACAEDEAMEVYRQGAVKLLNSLSRVSDVVRLQTADEEGTILRFNLLDLGWTATDWDSVLAVYPYAARPESQMFDLLATSTFTPLPYLRGDWFAFTASQPPLYNSLLGLADDFDGLQKQLGVDVAGGINNFTAKRAGFQKSGVSQNNRLIERHTIATGYFWTSYDFAGNRDRQSLFEFPLGPGNDYVKGYDPGAEAFDHDGGESIFSLPNGFQAYYLNAADGSKLDKGPTEIVRDPARRDQAVTNGLSCFGCHDQGIRKAKDDVRPHILADRTFPRAIRDAVEALYPPHEEMDAILEADTNKFLNAMRTAGLDPTLKFNGVEMINALAKRYEDDLGLAIGAAEFGQNEEEFLVSLNGTAVGEAVRLRRRLEQGVIPRDTFEALYHGLIEHVSDMIALDFSHLAPQALPVATVARPIEASRTFDLTLISDASNYRVGDKPVFTVYSEEACYLTLINVDGKGTATVIFPNQFQQDNFLPAVRDLNFPDATAPFQFRFADPGLEKVIAICSLQNRRVDAIDLDYSNAFTDLGNYETHVAKTRAIKVEARPTQTANIAPPAGTPVVLNKDGIVARTAIVMEVQ